MNKFEEEARKMQLEAASRNINMCFNSLVGKQERRTIPEDIFVNEFLPYFAGLKEITPESELISTWAAIAGTPFSEVNVIDSNNEVAVVVPALMQTLQNHLNNISNGNSFSDIVTEAEIRGSQLNVIGKRYLYEQLDIKQKELLDSVIPEANEPIVKQWETIFQKYGIVKEQKQMSEQSVKLDEDVDYE